MKGFTIARGDGMSETIFSLEKPHLTNIILEHSLRKELGNKLK